MTKKSRLQIPAQPGLGQLFYNLAYYVICIVYVKYIALGWKRKDKLCIAVVAITSMHTVQEKLKHTKWEEVISQFRMRN